MAFKQIVAARTGARDGLGWCLRHAQSVFGAPVAFDSAREAWDGQKGRHPGEAPPAGRQVTIWFDHTGTYGTPPVRKNWGHACTSLGDGRVLTSPLRYDQLGADGKGVATYPSMLAMMRDLGGNPRYLGWSEYLNGRRIVEPKKAAVTPARPSKPAGQEEEDDMIFIRKSAKDKVFAWSPQRGTKRHVGTTEWNAIKRAYGAAGLKLPLVDTTAAETKHFGI